MVLRRLILALVPLLVLFSIATAEPDPFPVTVKPKLGPTHDLSDEAKERWAAGGALLGQLSAGKRTYESLTPEEEELVSRVEMFEGPWATQGGGCSWYCGGAPGAIAASSVLASQGGNSYAAGVVPDFDLRTAWVEGREDLGVEESITFTFPKESPKPGRVTVYAGYQKSERTWRANARPSALGVYADRKPVARLNLADTRAAQTFELPGIDAPPGEVLELRFVLLGATEGERYADTAISEMNFGGDHVH